MNLIPPIDIDYKTGDLSLDLNPAFSKILSAKTHRKTIRKMNFIDRNVSVEQAVIILAKRGVQINEKETKIILEFLY